MFACTNERFVWPTAIVSSTLSNGLELSQVPSRQADYKYRCQKISLGLLANILMMECTQTRMVRMRQRYHFVVFIMPASNT